MRGHIAMHEQSIRRSRTRERALLMLSSLSESFATPLARACGISPNRLKDVMLGGHGYSVERSLVRLGLAELLTSPLGRFYAITPAGRRKARQLTARFVRREEARRRRRGARQVRPQVAPVAAQPVAPPVVAPASLTWSFPSAPLPAALPLAQPG